MGEPAKNLTVRVPDEIRNPYREAALRFGLKESDMVRMVLAQGARKLRKQRTILQVNAR